MPMLSTRVAIIGTLIGLSACAPTDPGDEMPVQRFPAGLRYSQLAVGITGSCNGAQPALIRNEADWQAFWAAVEPGHALPAVDFSTDSVLAACVPLADPGHRYEITAWEAHTPGQLTVHTTIASPACGAHPQVVVAGYHAIRVDGVYEAAEFQQAHSTRESCSLPQAQFGWETLARGHISGCAEATDLVIRTEEDWAAFWSSLNANVSPEPVRPLVDFTSESLIATCLGTRPDGGYVTDLKYLREPDGAGHVVVDGTEYVSGPTCAVTLAITQPYHIVRVNRVVTGATFRRLTFESACD